MAALHPRGDTLRFAAIRAVTVPLVILVNGNSASATEIVSGAVQDHDRGLIVGETTFGKGLVQTVQPLSENTGLALTTARYYTPSGRLIQRDYKSISLYEYHYERKVPEHPTEVKLTDSGRQVTGGGGITPDIVVPTPKFNHFQETLLRADVFYPLESGVGGFTRFYLGSKPAVAKDFEADDSVMKTFRDYLSKHNVRYTEPDMSENLDWVKRKIKAGSVLFDLRHARRLQGPARSGPPGAKGRGSNPAGPRTLPERAQDRGAAHRRQPRSAVAFQLIRLAVLLEVSQFCRLHACNSLFVFSLL